MTKRLDVGVVGQWLIPPLVRRSLPVGVRVDAIDRTRIDALVTPRTQFRNDDDVKVVVENGPKRLWARPETSVTSDTYFHVDLQRWVLP